MNSLIFNLKGSELGLYSETTQSLKEGGLFLNDEWRPDLQELPKSGWMINSIIYKNKSFVKRIKSNKKLEKMLAKTPSAADAWTGKCSKDETKLGNSGSLAQEVESGFLEEVRNWEKETPFLTPTSTQIGKRTKDGYKKRREFRESIGRSTLPPGNLEEQIQNNCSREDVDKPLDPLKFPTPTCMDSMTPPEREVFLRGNSHRTVTNQGVEGSAKLCEVVRYEDRKKKWPTPTSNPPGWKHIDVVDKDGNPPEHFNQRLYDKKTGRLVQKGLEQVVNMSKDTQKFPTPNAWDGARGPLSKENAESGEHQISLVTAATHDPEGSSGQLNPHWVAWLMGYPLPWCDDRSALILEEGS